jgi:serine/threonine protein kinase
MTQDYLIGAQLDEYRLEALLGRGGMARVYRGLDVNLNRYAAIKVIDLPHRDKDDYIRRFQREAQAIAQLEHPHIVQLYRYGDAHAGPGGDRLLYMAMQFIDGADLQALLDTYREDGQMMESQPVSQVVREVGQALDYAHQKGIIHRDIKSSNIMLDRQGRAILTDFGLALLSTQATRGEIFGSPSYIAPEQAMSSANAVPQSDLYSLGVILYEMVTGVLPFVAGEPLELAMMHMTQPVPSPRSLRPEISVELEQVLLKALEKKPQDRYPTGRALADALEMALLGKRQALPTPNLSIPERVSHRLATRSLPPPPPRAFTPDRQDLAPHTVQRAEPVPALQPQRQAPPPATAVSPAAPMTSAGQPPAVQPAASKPAPGFWLAAGLLALLLILLCVTGSGAFLYSQFGSQAGQTPAAGGLLSTATMEPDQPQPTRPAVLPAVTIAPTQPTPLAYQFLISRRGEDKGYLVIHNTGAEPLSLEALLLLTGKAGIPGTAWGLSELPPGACLLTRREDRKADGLPGDISCNLLGPTLVITQQSEGVFKDRLEVVFGEQAVGVCERGQTQCQISFSR